MSTEKPVNLTTFILAVVVVLVAVLSFKIWASGKEAAALTQAATQAVKAIPDKCPSTQDEAIALITPTTKALGLNAGTLGVYDPPRAEFGVLIRGDLTTILTLRAVLFNHNNCVHRAYWGDDGEDRQTAFLTIHFDNPAADKVDNNAPANPAILPPLPCPKEKGDCEALQGPRLDH